MTSSSRTSFSSASTNPTISLFSNLPSRYAPPLRAGFSVSYPGNELAIQVVTYLVVWLVGWLVGHSLGCLVGWSVSWSVAWLVGQLVGSWLRITSSSRTSFSSTSTNPTVSRFSILPSRMLHPYEPFFKSVIQAVSELVS